MDEQQSSYFAQMQMYSNDYGKACLNLEGEYNKYINRIGFINLLRKSYQTYFRAMLHRGEVVQLGQRKEFAGLYVNEYRNFIQHMITITTTMRPEPEPRATNTDYKSMAQVILARTLLEYVNKEKKVERFGKQAVEDALWSGEGFVLTEWDANAGEKLIPDPDTGKMKYTGDIALSNFHSINAIRDTGLRDGALGSWVMFRCYGNKQNLAAQFPEKSQEILKTTYNDKDIWLNFWEQKRGEKTDIIPYFKVFHEKNTACPEGRFSIIIPDGTVLLDGPLPYRKLPVARIAPANMTGTPFGYSGLWDILPLQKMVDILYSTITTNQKTFGVQNIVVEKGTSINPSFMTGGLNLLEIPKGGLVPQGLNLTRTAPETYNFLPMLDKKMEDITGINAVVRGNPPAGLTAGVSLALLNENAIRSSQYLQISYSNMYEDMYSNILTMYIDFGNSPRTIMIAGKSNRSYTKEFTGDDLSMIERVTVDLGNPLNRTTSGRYSIAMELLKNGMVDDPNQLIQVLTTGRYEPVYEHAQSQLMLIKSENEMMQNGQMPNATITDDHFNHLLEHETVMNSPDERNNPQSMVITAATQHIQQHLDMARQLAMLNPMILEVFSPQMLGRMPMPQKPPPRIPASQGQNHPSSQPGNGEDKVRDTNTVKNPVTGEVLQPSQPVGK